MTVRVVLPWGEREEGDGPRAFPLVLTEITRPRGSPPFLAPSQVLPRWEARRTAALVEMMRRWMERVKVEERAPMASLSLHLSTHLNRFGTASHQVAATAPVARIQ